MPLDRCIRKWRMKNKFYVGKSNIRGVGCFAAMRINKGERICIMNGERLSIQTAIKRYESGKYRDDDPLQIGERSYLKLEKPFIYFNHSCGPNAGIMMPVRLSL